MKEAKCDKCNRTEQEIIDSGDDSYGFIASNCRDIEFKGEICFSCWKKEKNSSILNILNQFKRGYFKHE